MNEDSKALYHKLVTNKIIPEIKEDHDNELTKEETNLLSGPNNCSKYPTNAASVPTVIEPLMAK